MNQPNTLEICVICLGLFLLMADAFFVKTDKRTLGYGAIVGLCGVLVLSFISIPQYRASGFYDADTLGMFFKQFSIVATIITLILTIDYAPIVERFIPSSAPQAGVGEYFVLPIFTCAGFMWLATAADFIMIFCALELVTISYYIQVAYLRRSVASLEAGTKYLILGALSTGFLVYGITWVFGMTGQTDLHQIAYLLKFQQVPASAGLLFGIGLVLVAIGFKIAAVPFHFWVPDVYQGAPTPTTASLSVASKAAGFAILLRVLSTVFASEVLREKVLPVLGVLAVATLIYGNLAAIPQMNFKRLLGYSSIAHAGYLLVGLASMSQANAGFVMNAIYYYLFGYLLMTFLAFLVLVPVAKASGGDEISQFNGLARRSPWLARALLLAVASLIGLPITVGFMGKFQIIMVAMEQQKFGLVAVSLIAFGCGVYYYSKVVRAMYWQAPAENAAAIVVSPLSRIAMAVLAFLILFFGFYPDGFLNILR